MRCRTWRSACSRRSPSCTEFRASTDATKTRNTEHDRDQGREQVVRQLPGAQALLHPRQERRSGGGVRAVRIGQIDADQDGQRARAVPERRNHRQRHLRQRHQDRPAQAARENRHGVPELRAVPAHEDHREPDHRPDQGPQPQPGRSPRARAEDARPRRPDRAKGQISRASSPAASSSASPSRARCRWTRSRCCSTSRPRRSIRR